MAIRNKNRTVASLDAEQFELSRRRLLRVYALDAVAASRRGSRLNEHYVSMLHNTLRMLDAVHYIRTGFERTKWVSGDSGNYGVDMLASGHMGASFYHFMRWRSNRRVARPFPELDALLSEPAAMMRWKRELAEDMDTRLGRRERIFDREFQGVATISQDLEVVANFVRGRQLAELVLPAQRREEHRFNLELAGIDTSRVEALTLTALITRVRAVDKPARKRRTDLIAESEFDLLAGQLILVDHPGVGLGQRFWSHSPTIQRPALFNRNVRYGPSKADDFAIQS